MFLMLTISISIGASVLFWDRNVKGRAAVHRAFRPRPAAVPANDPLDVGQADARARELALAVQALKHAEQFAGVTRIEPHAVVANVNHVLIFTPGRATDFDFSLGAGAGELHRIGKQV